MILVITDPSDNCEDEISQHFGEKEVSRNTNPLQWWKMNELRFKHMSRVVRSILAASERLFSTAGLLERWMFFIWQTTAGCW